MRRFLFLCGVLSPLVYILATIIGGALRPGYSHMANSVSELLSPGSPNRQLMVVMHTASALFSILFGIGLLQFVRTSSQSTPGGLVGAGLIILLGVLNIGTAALFPQDAMGTEATFAGKMHLILVGLMVLVSLIATSLLGIWFSRSGIYPRFALYSFITIAVLAISGVYSMTKLGTPTMGLTERISVAITFQWNIVLAIKLLLR